MTPEFPDTTPPPASLTTEVAPPPPPEPRRYCGISVEWWIVIGLTLLGGALRFWKLGHASLWGDEINFVLHSAQPTFSQYLNEYIDHFAPPNFPPHLPVATIIEFLFLRFGIGDFLGRFPAALLGTLTIPMAFVAARVLFDRVTGVAAAALVSLSFFLIYYSREANYYAPLVFFSMTFLAVFWTFLMQAVRGVRVPFWGLALVWFSGTILLQTHLAAVLFVAALGLSALAVCVVTLRELPAEQRMPTLRKRFLPLVIAYLLCWVLVMPWIVWTLGLEPSVVDIPPHRQPTLANIMKLFARFGWGNISSHMAPAAVLFWGCAVAGLFMGIRNSESRRTVGMLVFVGLFFVAVFWRNIRTNGLSPHYLILTLIPVLFIAALGMRLIGKWMAAKFNRAGLAIAFPAAALLFLATFLVYPLQLLYQLPGKPTDWRGIAQWMSENLPKGTTVYFDWYVNVWQHVPTYYPTPGITCASTMPVGSADHMIQMRYRDYTKYTLMKYSDAAYLEAMRLFDTDPRFNSPELGGTKWDWPAKYFRRSKSFRNDPILELDRLGICPIALNHTNLGEVEPILYYNTPEDLEAIHRELLEKNPAQAPRVFRRFTSGFRHAQVPFAHVLRGGGNFITQIVGERSLREICNAAAVEILNLSHQQETAEIRLVGAAVISLSADRFNQLSWVAMPTFGMGAQRYMPRLPDADIRVRLFVEGEEVGVARLPTGMLLAASSPEEHRLAVEESLLNNLKATEAVAIRLKPNERVEVKLVVESSIPAPQLRVLLDDVIVTAPKSN